MNKTSLVFIIILIAAVSGAVYFFIQSDGHKVKGRINGLAKQVSREGGEAVVKTALRLRGVGGFLGDPVLLEMENYDLIGDYTPDEVTGLASLASAQFKVFILKFYDIEVEFQDEEFVFVAATAIVTGQMSSGEGFDEAKEVDMELIKSGGEWYITRISSIDVLEK